MAFPPPQTIYGIIGTIRLRLGTVLRVHSNMPDTYVILMTGKESVGHLQSHEVWQMTKFEIIPLRLGKANAIQALTLVFKGLMPGS